MWFECPSAVRDSPWSLAIVVQVRQDGPPYPIPYRNRAQNPAYIARIVFCKSRVTLRLAGWQNKPKRIVQVDEGQLIGRNPRSRRTPIWNSPVSVQLRIIVKKIVREYSTPSWDLSKHDALALSPRAPLLNSPFAATIFGYSGCAQT